MFELLGAMPTPILPKPSLAPGNPFVIFLQFSPPFAYLYKPSLTTRVRDNMFHDTPLPPEEPTGENPPDGAILDYQLNADARLVQLEIVKRNGEVIRTYRSDDAPEVRDSTAMPHPTYWIKPEQKLGTSKGHHRFIWDLKYEPPRGAPRQFSIAAVYKSTPSGPHGSMVNPGTYSVRLTVDGETSERPLTVRMDPRVVISENALKIHHDISVDCYEAVFLSK